MVEGHLNQGSFDSEIVKLGPKLVDASIELHRHVMNNFLPSAVKFHYQFNLRELSNITQVSRSTYVTIKSLTSAMSSLRSCTSILTCKAWLTLPVCS